MSDYNVETFSYKYALKCYMNFIAGNVNAADAMYEKGKEISESDKWKSEISAWNSQDINIYVDEDEDEVPSEIEQQSETTETTQAQGTGGDNGLVNASSAISGISGIVSLFATVTEGSIPGAMMYSVLSTMYLAITAVLTDMAQKSVQEQQEYFTSIDEYLTHEYEAEVAEADNLNEKIMSKNAKALESFAKVSSDTASMKNIQSAPAVGAGSGLSALPAVNLEAIEPDSVAVAKGTGATNVIAEIETLDAEILSDIESLDAVIEQIDEQKSALNDIFKKIPAFEKQREEYKNIMTTLTINAVAGAAFGAIGLAMSWVNLTLAPLAMAFFAAGITLFGVSAIVAGAEIGVQNKASKDLDEVRKQAEAKGGKAEETKTETNEIKSAGQGIEASVVSIQGEAQKEVNEEALGAAA